MPCLQNNPARMVGVSRIEYPCGIDVRCFDSPKHRDARQVQVESLNRTPLYTLNTFITSSPK